MPLWSRPPIKKEAAAGAKSIGRLVSRSKSIHVA